MATNNRQSFLTLDPVKFSLTDGTNIPAPEDTPPATSNGPETTQTNKTTSAVQTTDDVPQDATQKSQTNRAQGPPSVLSNSTSPQRHGVRRLFSLGSLRSSFSSSRASLTLPQDTAQRQDGTNGIQQPSSPSTAQPPTSSPKGNKLRKSDNWFKRKSGMLFSSGGERPLASIGEDGPDSKRVKEHSPAPLLPDINSLGGGDLKDGEVEWDERLFKKPT